jgi:transcriptional regulator with XRE-family HTH domain
MSNTKKNRTVEFEYTTYVTLNGPTFRTQRLERGKTLKELAVPCGITAGYLSEIERELRTANFDLAKRLLKELKA